MAKDVDELQKLDFETNNHSIIYAPNSTGKTRLTKKLQKKYENESAMFLTSSEITNMLSFSGRKIFVGSDSAKKLDSENIIKEINKTGYGAEIMKLYNVKSASALSKQSFLFKKLGLKKKDSFDIYDKLASYNGESQISQIEANLSLLVNIDKKLSGFDLNEFKRIASENIVLSLGKNDHVISQELKSKLIDLANSINSKQCFCPLCGQKYIDNHELKTVIEHTLRAYVIDSTAKEYEECTLLFNALNDINNEEGIVIFKINNDESDISINLLLNNISIIENCVQSLSHLLERKAESFFDKRIYNRFLDNRDFIEKENGARKSNLGFYNDVVKSLNDLITLPDGFAFKKNGEKIEIFDSNNNAIDAKTFLSESEQRRMCISIVLAEIRQRNLQYVIFDDPVDSNDDYYFDVAANIIGDMLLNETNISWIVLTHEFKMVSIFSERCIASCDQYDKSVSFLFYLPDPSFRGNGALEFFLVDMQPIQLRFLLEHETIIFRKIFTGESDYQCEQDLALLSSFNCARNLYNEILFKHQISNHKNYKLAKAISIGNSSYEHFKNGKKGIMRLSTLSMLNKAMYKDCSSAYFSRSRFFAANYRTRYVNTAVFSEIKSKNVLLKYILFVMVRVMDLHYLFEKKLVVWSFKNIGSFDFNKFEKKKGLWQKIHYVKSICRRSPDLFKYEICFRKWRGLLNDFAHGASRMIPPYLTVSPIEMNKLANDIALLP